MKRRIGGRVESWYAGGGATAEEFADLVRRRLELAALRREWRRADEAAAADDREFRGWTSAVEGVYRGAMEAAGYHRLSRGPWRKRRMETSPARTPDVDLKALAKAARAGDGKAAHALVAATADDPGKLVELAGGPIERLVEEVLAHEWSKGKEHRDELQFHRLRAEAARLRAELLAEGEPTALQRLLVSRVVACWIRVAMLEVGISGVGLGLGGVRVLERTTRLLDSAHNRLIASIRALAAVRRASAPTVQVTVAQQVITGVDGLHTERT